MKMFARQGAVLVPIAVPCFCRCLPVEGEAVSFEYEVEKCFYNDWCVIVIFIEFFCRFFAGKYRLFLRNARVERFYVQRHKYCVVRNESFFDDFAKVSAILYKAR